MFVFFRGLVRFGLYPGSKNVGGVVEVVTVVVEVGGVVVVVEVGGVVVVVTAVALAAALASCTFATVGLNGFAFAFHLIFTFGGLVLAAGLLPFLRFLFLPLSASRSAISSHCLPFSADAASTKSSNWSQVKIIQSPGDSTQVILSGRITCVEVIEQCVPGKTLFYCQVFWHR